MLDDSSAGLGLDASQSAFTAELNEADDNFGYSLSAADFDGDGDADLAIGVPGEDFDESIGSDSGAAARQSRDAAGAGAFVTIHAGAVYRRTRPVGLHGR